MADGGATSYFLLIVKTIAKILKILYLILATIFVCHSLYTTVSKVEKEKVNIKVGVTVISKIKFPSITFCHKYKHGGKDALTAYSTHLFESWKKSGKFGKPLDQFIVQK